MKELGTPRLRVQQPARMASVAAMTTATGAVACGVCCVLPFAFPAVAAAGAGSVLAWLGSAHSWVTIIAMVIVAAAWTSIGIQSHRTRATPARTTLRVMALATGVLVIAIIWPRIEPWFIRLLTPDR